MKPDSRRLSTLVFAISLTAWPAMAQQQATLPEGGPHHAHQTADLGKPAMLGVVVERISDDLRYQLPAVKPGAGLIIRQLLPNGPAAQAHLETMDILLMWNDQSLVHPAQLQVLAHSSHPGDKVTLEYLHRGVLTKTEITLAEQAEAPAHGHTHHLPGAATDAPAAQLGALLGNDIVRQAADALAKSGIDANAVAGMLKGVELPKLDPATLRGSKLVIFAADGTRREINLGEVMKPNGNFGELLKTLDLGKGDPAAWLGSKIVLIAPDGTQKEINLAELLKTGGAIDEMLKGLGRP